MTALIRTPSLLMPSANAAGYTLGGNAWFQTKFKLSDSSTWSGIIIDPDGSYIGSANIGLTVWVGATKKVQIRDTGISIFGGASCWVPDGYDINTPSTWNGVAINSTGLYCFLAGVQTIWIANTGNFIFGSVTNKKISFVASTGVLTFDPGILVTGGSTAGTLGYTVTGSSRAYLGLNSSGNAVLSISTGNITENGSNPTNGVIIDATGFRGYAGGVQKIGIDTSGNAFFAGALTAASIESGYSFTMSTASTPGSIVFTNVATINAIYTDASHRAFYISSAAATYGTFSIGNPNTFNSINLSASSSIGLTVGSIQISLGTGGSYTVGKLSVDCTTQDAILDVKNRSAGTIATSTLYTHRIEGIDTSSFGSDTLYLQYGSSGKGVVIGDTGSDHPLTVYGTIDLKSYVNIDAVYGSEAGFCLKSAGAGRWYIYRPVNSYNLQFYDISYPGGDRLVLFAGGGAAFGTSGTGNPLGVYGSIASATLGGSGNRLVYSDGSGFLTNSSSDSSLKTDIVTLPYGLAEVLLLNPIKFGWIQKAVFGAQKEIGFIAQEIEQIIPEVVGMNYDGMKSLDYPKLTAVLCRAIQELNAKLEAHLNG